MTGNIDDVQPPRSMKNIVQAVAEYVHDHALPSEEDAPNFYPSDFRAYDDALHAVWPELHKSDPKAHLLVSISIYYELAERLGFELNIPEDVARLRL